MAENIESVLKCSILKPIKFKPSNHNLNKIIEIEYLDRYVKGLPPIRMTHKKFQEYWNKENKKYLERLRKFISDYQKAQEYDKKHQSKITFAFALS